MRRTMALGTGSHRARQSSAPGRDPLSAPPKAHPVGVMQQVVVPKRGGKVAQALPVALCHITQSLVCSLQAGAQVLGRVPPAGEEPRGERAGHPCVGGGPRRGVAALGRHAGRRCCRVAHTVVCPFESARPAPGQRRDAAERRQPSASTCARQRALTPRRPVPEGPTQDPIPGPASRVRRRVVDHGCGTRCGGRAGGSVLGAQGRGNFRHCGHASKGCVARPRANVRGDGREHLLAAPAAPRRPPAGPAAPAEAGDLSARARAREPRR